MTVSTGSDARFWAVQQALRELSSILLGANGYSLLQMRPRDIAITLKITNS